MRLLRFNDAPLPTRMANSQLGIGAAPTGYEKGISLSPVDVGAGGLLRNQSVQYTHDGQYVPAPYPIRNLLDEEISNLNNDSYWTTSGDGIAEIVTNSAFALRGRKYGHLRAQGGRIPTLGLGLTHPLAVAPDMTLGYRFYSRGHGTLRLRIRQRDEANTEIRRDFTDYDVIADEAWTERRGQIALTATTNHVSFDWQQRGTPYGDVFIDLLEFFVPGRHPDNLLFNGDFAFDAGWTASGDGAWTRTRVDGVWRYAHVGASGNFSLASTQVRSLLPRLRGEKYWFSMTLAGTNTASVCLRGTWRNMDGAAIGTVISHCPDIQVDGPQEFGIVVERPSGAVYLDADVIRETAGASDFYLLGVALHAVSDQPMPAKRQYDAVNAQYGTRGRLWARLDDGRERWIYARLHTCQNRQSMIAIGAQRIDASFAFESEGILWFSHEPTVYSGTLGDEILIVNEGEDTWHARLELDLTSANDRGNTASVTVSVGDVHLVLTQLQIDAGNKIVIDGYTETVRQTIAGVESPAFGKLQLAPNHAAPRLLIVPRGISRLVTAGTHLDTASGVKLTFYAGYLA